MLPYGKQSINNDDIQAVMEVLQSDWLTTGPAVESFEQRVAEKTNSVHAVATSSGTAALHAAVAAVNIGPGDEVVVPAHTFAATANVVVYQGAKPVFADVDPDTLLLDPKCVQSKINSRTRAVFAVDFAGQPCDYSELSQICRDNGLCLIADACHSLGATYQLQPAGNLADITCFSFHPVKSITSAEGGMAVTNDPQWAQRMRQFRNHGITSDFRQRSASAHGHYEMRSLGFNYRLSDLHAALGASQLSRLDSFIESRRLIANSYHALLGELPGVTALTQKCDRTSAHHLFVIRVDAASAANRDQLLGALRAGGIGSVVHYPPVHLHPYYREKFNTQPGMCPVTERAAGEILSLPIHPQMNSADVDRVVDTMLSLFTPCLS